MKKLVEDFFRDNDLSWNMVSAVCSDGAPAMLGRHSGFGALVKSDAPHIIVTHGVLHRHALATKTLPPKLAEVLKIVVECVNYVRNSAMKHRIFKELCKEMGSEFEVLLYHSNVWWLSKGAESCFCHACGISPVFARVPTLSRRLLRKFCVHSHFGIHGRYFQCSQSSQSTDAGRWSQHHRSGRKPEGV